MQKNNVKFVFVCCVFEFKVIFATTKQDPWSIILPTPYQNHKIAVQMKIDTQAYCMNTISKESFDRVAKHTQLEINN